MARAKSRGAVARFTRTGGAAISKSYRSGLSAGRSAARVARNNQELTGRVLQGVGAAGFGLCEQKLDLWKPLGVNLSLLLGASHMLVSVMAPSLFQGSGIGRAADAVLTGIGNVAAYKVGSGSMLGEDDANYASGAYDDEYDEDSGDDEDVSGESYADAYSPGDDD